jgi:hypothetical protein
VSNFAEERDQVGIPVITYPEDSVELHVPSTAETWSAAIVMYGFAVALVVAMGIGLVWFARWAL